MILSAAIVPGAPLMLPEYRSLEDPGAPWREASIEALVRALRIAQAGPGATELVVVAPIATGAMTTTHAYRSAPPGLRVARMIVEGAIERGSFDPVATPIEEVAVAEDSTLAEAETLGLVVSNLPPAQGSSEEEGRTVLLVVADGSARRGLRAPGHLDERAFGFDADWLGALESGSPQGLLDLDSGLATELLATGRPPLQVLGAATRDRTVTAEVLASGDPFGVAYCVAVWACT